ncbi:MULTISPECIES: hypothetical protein [unclassified Streptomyces]|uniref:hypothetical protein n=1 Tax=unclassified Streptomyces TaxID=2593676 RepID=UPI000F6EAB0E|nr:MULTISPECIES: hypothetical protein [unclassified Streptomyces]AZM63646.1 hypothetical protein DLM49_32370 [Streptomyces sp. WAC 01438]RSM92974.1 hypothetical protein DMA10_22610 [Streptomyces sp. WAC 01420]
MRNRALAISLGMAVAFTGLSATTANAYRNADITISSWQPDTGSCPCSDSSGLDYTSFKKDAGGKGMKLVVKKNGTPVAQMEFHPYDEVLYAYDGKNDGDTIYFRAMWYEGIFKKEATYWAPGTSKVLDVNKVQMAKDDDIEEGTTVHFRVFDDKALKDPLTPWYRYNARA